MQRSTGKEVVRLLQNAKEQHHLEPQAPTFEDSLPSILANWNDGSIDDYSPITAKDYDPLNEPMSALPAELIPTTREEEKKHPKLVFAYALLRPQLIICAHRMDVVPLETLQKGNSIPPLIRITAALSRKYGRQRAACTPFVDRVCGVIGPHSNRTLPYFFGGTQRNADLLAKLREDPD